MNSVKSNIGQMKMFYVVGQSINKFSWVFPYTIKVAYIKIKSNIIGVDILDKI